MSFLKKTWLARLGVGLNRFRMNNSTDVVLESNPISVTQQGDQLSADNMNNLETRIGNAFDEMAGNLAPIEVSPASTNHTVGTQLVYNGILYKVISAISTGDNLVVGTNIEPYPVSSAISDIIDTFEAERINCYGYTLGTSKAITPRPYKRIGFAFGVFSTNWDSQLIIPFDVTIPKDSTSITVSSLTLTTSSSSLVTSGTYDFILFTFRLS